jgi:hypothetical protein
VEALPRLPDKIGANWVKPFKTQSRRAGARFGVHE